MTVSAAAGETTDVDRIGRGQLTLHGLFRSGLLDEPAYIEATRSLYRTFPERFEDWYEGWKMSR